MQEKLTIVTIFRYAILTTNFEMTDRRRRRRIRNVVFRAAGDFNG